MVLSQSQDCATSSTYFFFLWGLLGEPTQGLIHTKYGAHHWLATLIATTIDSRIFLSLHKETSELSAITQTCNSSTWEEEAGGVPQVRSQHRLDWGRSVNKSFHWLARDSTFVSICLPLLFHSASLYVAMISSSSWAPVKQTRETHMCH